MATFEEGNITRIAQMIDWCMDIEIGFYSKIDLCDAVKQARVNLWQALLTYKPEEIT
jgi:hypothetical protein